MVPMAAKHGAHRRLNAQNAMIATEDPPIMMAKEAHMEGSASPASPKLVKMPTVATTFSFATNPVTEVTAACQSPNPRGVKIHASRLPKPAIRLYWM